MKTYCHTPVGWLALTASDQALVRIRFLETKPDNYPQRSNPVIQEVKLQLTEYFQGNLQQFSIPLQPEGSDFQQSVWQELRDIPYGETSTYGALARQLGDPKKMRAVGRANGQNPIPIIIPCHRVIGADGKLTGYGGGIARKRWLLKHEGALLL